MDVNDIAEILEYILYMIVGLIFAYTIRHYLFTLNRIYGHQRQLFREVHEADWPTVTVFVAAHNEEQVIANSMDALLNVEYPSEKLQIIIVNDRSVDKTKEIVDSYVAEYPGRIVPFHREIGPPGKPAALQDAKPLASGDILIFFDADYLPGVKLIKQLAAGFFDPEVGLVMGRVIPLNTNKNILTRLLDLERSGGYQVDQQARMNLDFVPQYGGTVGGIRKELLKSLGGWNAKALAEDTDVTIRALVRGWKTAYMNYSECYEESPERWNIRINQIKRWAKGHNQVFYHYVGVVLNFKNKYITHSQRLDAVMLLFLYMMSPLLILGWCITLLLIYLSYSANPAEVLVFSYISFCAMGNFAAYFEIATAVHFDRGKQKLRLLPLNIFNFIVSAVSITSATLSQISNSILRKKKAHIWDKTERFRDEGDNVIAKIS